MSSAIFLKRTFILSLLALSALSGIAPTDTAHADSRAEDEFGLRITPMCSYTWKSAVDRASGDKPTGQIRSIKLWDLEIYENPQTKSWTLLGQSNTEGATKKLCYLSNGSGDYTQEKWYRRYFIEGAQ